MHSSSMNRRSLPVVLFIEVTAGKVRNVQPPESDPNNGLHTPTVAARVTEPQRTPTMAEAVDATADRTPSSRAKDNPKVKDQPRLHKDLVAEALPEDHRPKSCQIRTRTTTTAR